jgi:hypothetical protein
MSCAMSITMWLHHDIYLGRYEKWNNTGKEDICGKDVAGLKQKTRFVNKQLRIWHKKKLLFIYNGVTQD